VNGEVEFEIELVDEPTDVDRNGEELVDVDARHSEAAQPVDEIAEIVVRVIDLVRLTGRGQDHKAVGATVQHDVLGRIGKRVDNFLDVLLGAPTPMMGDVKQDGLRVGMRLREGQGDWQRTRHQQPLHA
jgi:hypothetical protein